MNRYIAAFALASALASCTSEGGSVLQTGTDVGIATCNQPLVADTAEECVTSSSSGSSGSTTSDPGEIYATDMNADLTANGMSYDPATDQVVFDNVPFDGDDNVYVRNAATTNYQAASGSSFGTYNNASGTSAPTTEFFAVFRRSPGDYSQVGALGSRRYVSYGFGGAGVQRLNGDGSLPDADQSYVFTGEYAAVRTIVESGTATEIQYVAGTSSIDVDIQDFNNVGAVEGFIVNRQFFDVNGVEVAGIGGRDFIRLATAEINFDSWTITSSTATLQVGNSIDKDATIDATTTGGTQTASGTWEGLFAGPNGEEVAGIVFVEGVGAVGVDAGTGLILTSPTVRETGVFQARRP
ncbi:hypothetical protein [Sagittula salina]|uniref:Transferrin-binding protein B C-lobe/N-lobe beta barrel domain-containing protein n=1 Tax=Sagittula salina TaxID=2820268 RepID=A0A940ML98_9RHOB|nr:hypothetical protein [Sagittula salina]MBP0483581.1 hypothetical protein [Sagittula salina]